MTWMLLFFSYTGHFLFVDRCWPPQFLHLASLSHLPWALPPHMIQISSLLHNTFRWPYIKHLKHCFTGIIYGLTLIVNFLFHNQVSVVIFPPLNVTTMLSVSSSVNFFVALSKLFLNIISTFRMLL